MIRRLRTWFSPHWKVVKARLNQLSKNLEELLEDAADFGSDFLALIDAHGKAIEAKVVQIEHDPALVALTGNERFQKLLEWIKDALPELVHHTPRVRAWVSALVAARKLLGLFR